MPSKQVEDVYNAMTPDQRANWGRGGGSPSDRRPRAEISMDATAIKKAIAHYLSRQGSAEFDFEGVSLTFNSATGEFSADAIERR